MAENYGTLEGTLDEHGVLSGEMSDRATLEGEIQFGSGGGGVLDVFQNGQSVVQGRYAYVTVPTFLRELRSDDYHNTVTSLEMQIWNSKADPSDIPTALSDLQGDSDHRLVTDAEKTEWSNKSNVSANPSITTETLTSIEIDGTAYAIPSGGSGDVTDVKVNNASVVDAQGVANIDLTGYAEKSDLGTASSKDVPATGNAGANEVVLGNDTRLSDSRPASDVSSWAKADSKPTYQYSEIQNTPSLGTAAAKDFDNSVIDGSSNLVTGDAVHDAIDNAVSGAYKHAGTKTCAELISSLLVKANAGNVYNMTDNGTTTSDFIEGAGLPIRAGDNVGVAKIDENTYKFDLLSGFVDTSNFITKSSTSGLVKNDGSIDTTSYQPTESGKGLSTNDYDNIAKGKVDALGTASTKNVPTSGDAGNNEVVLGNDTRLTDARPASDVSAWAKESTKPSYTKSEVGLGNVDNTSDSTKKTNFTGSIASGDTGFTTGGDVYTALGGKADKVSGATNGNLAGLNGSGNLTDSGWNGAKDTTSISGNPISISGLKANQLAINPIITLEPIQDLHGQSKPYPAGGGKNLIPMTVDGLIALNTGGTWNGRVYTVNNVTFTILTDDADNVIGIKVNGTANSAASFGVGVVGFTSGTGYIINGSVPGFNDSQAQIWTDSPNAFPAGNRLNSYNSNSKSATANATENGRVSIIIYNGVQITNQIFYPMIRKSTESDSSFAPYSNICLISGYDKIEVLSCGKNIFDKSQVVAGGLDNDTGEETSSTGVYRSGWMRVKPNTTYMISGIATLRPFYYGQGKIFIERSSTTTGSTFTTPSGCGYVRFQIASSTWSSVTNPQVEEGNQATTYVPYNKATDISESLGQTVYGGSLDVRTGIFRVTWKKIVYDGSSDENWLKSTNAFYIAESNLQKVLDYTNYIKCDRLQTTSNHMNVVDGSVTNAIVGYRDSGGAYPGQNWFYIGVSGISDVTSLKTWLSNNPIEVCYTVATPTEIQLTPHEISLLKDYAYLSTNGTSIALDYHNGELASLADVSQLGETVNELGDTLPVLFDNLFVKKIKTTISGNAPTTDELNTIVFPTLGALIVDFYPQNANKPHSSMIYSVISAKYGAGILFSYYSGGIISFVRNNNNTWTISPISYA